ncbi:MAG: sensor histidine kinase, partial [Pseudomonadota bacterium]
MQFFKGLSGRLLVLTLIVVMLVEVAVFVPSVSRFRLDYLTERLARAEIASLTLDAAPANVIPETLMQELLDSAEVINIVVERDGVRQFILSRHEVPMVGETYDLSRMPFWTMIWDALRRMVTPVTGDAIRVIGELPHGGAELIEITLDPAPLKAAMIDYGWRILKLSLIISLITACGVFVLISKMVVLPLTRLTESVTAFRENPEDPANTIVPSSKSGEIAEAERALADMQEDVRRALKERARLAGLGEAVAKISH